MSKGDKEATASSSSPMLAAEFNRELNSISESHAPVTKAKMSSIVREALKAVKYYKHVVYHVENFIKNCDTEFKLAGVYVIDAIIRHSRSQYNCNDLFAPRFAANLAKTFKYVLRCPASDREKVSRVLNLWQRNEIFATPLVTQLLDMTQNAPQTSNTSNNSTPDKKKQLTKLIELKNNLNAGEIDASVLTEIHKITAKLLESESKTPTKKQKKMLDDDNETSSDNNDDEDDYHEVEKRFSDNSERLRLSLSNCSEWLNNKFGGGGGENNNNKASQQQSVVSSNGNININSLNLTKEQKDLYNNLMAPKIEPISVAGGGGNGGGVKRAIDNARDVDENERKRKGLPPIMHKHLCILSKTLWIGHLAKSFTENDLKHVLEHDYNAHVIDIHMIPPRGCAYIQFERRREASKCLDRMRDVRLHGNNIKIAWAANKGAKDLSSRGKAQWNGDYGCTYIPWDNLNDSTNLQTLSEGGTIDEDTIPDQLRAAFQRQSSTTTTKDASPSSSTPTTNTTSDPPLQMPNETHLRLNQPPPPPLIPQLIQFTAPPPPPMPPPPPQGNPSQIQLQFAPHFQVIRAPIAHQLQLYPRGPPMPHMSMLAHHHNHPNAANPHAHHHLIRQLLPPGAAILQQIHAAQQDAPKIDSPQFIQFAARHPHHHHQHSLQAALGAPPQLHSQFAFLAPAASQLSNQPSEIASIVNNNNNFDEPNIKSEADVGSSSVAAQINTSQIPQLMTMNFAMNKDFANEIATIKNSSSSVDGRDRDEHHNDVDSRDLTPRSQFNYNNNNNNQHRRSGLGNNYNRGGGNHGNNNSWRNNRFSSNGSSKFNGGRNTNERDRFSNSSFRGNGGGGGSRFKHETASNELVINNSFNSNLLINNYNINSSSLHVNGFQSSNQSNGSASGTGSSGVSHQVEDMHVSDDEEHHNNNNKAYNRDRAGFYLNQAPDTTN